MRTRLSRKTVCWALGLWVLFASPLGLCAQQTEESSVKAAFVYNFILFTDWPPQVLQAEETVDLCVSAGSPMATSLSVLDGKPIKHSRIRLQRLDSLKAVPASCRIVYLDRLSRPSWPQLKKQLANASILTISDDGEINANGVMIGLSTHNNRIVFDIDVHAAETAGLRINSKLLRLARKVR